MLGYRKAPIGGKRQRGMSIIELMVAIAVGLILTAGLIQIFVTSKQVFRLQESAIWLQENARYSLNTLAYDLRMAGHWGGVEADVLDLDNNLLISCEQGANKLPNNEVIGIMGFEGGAKCDSETLDTIANSDVLAVQYAAIDQRTRLSDLSGSEPFVASLAGFGGMLQKGSVLKSTAHFQHAGEDIKLVYSYPYYSAVYFVRPCSAMESGECVDSIPTLVRLVWDGSDTTQEPVAENIETMQIEYGIADDDDTVTEYMDAGKMSATDWDNVSAVRIALVVRSGEKDTSHEDSHDDENKYDLPGDETTPDDYAVTGLDKHYRRKVMTQVIQVRNSSRS